MTVRYGCGDWRLRRGKCSLLKGTGKDVHAVLHCVCLTGRLRRSSVLVVGARGLGAELCKNIVLAGVRSVTLLDHAPLTPASLGSRFLGRTDGVNVRRNNCW